jgi:hypothetical protein
MHRHSGPVVISRADKSSLLARIEPHRRPLALDQTRLESSFEKQIESGDHGNRSPS